MTSECPTPIQCTAIHEIQSQIAVLNSKLDKLTDSFQSLVQTLKSERTVMMKSKKTVSEKGILYESQRKESGSELGEEDYEDEGSSYEDDDDVTPSQSPTVDQSTGLPLSDNPSIHANVVKVEPIDLAALNIQSTPSVQGGNQDSYSAGIEVVTNENRPKMQINHSRQTAANIGTYYSPYVVRTCVYPIKKCSSSLRNRMKSKEVIPSEPAAPAPAIPSIFKQTASPESVNVSKPVVSEPSKSVKESEPVISKQALYSLRRRLLKTAKKSRTKANSGNSTEGGPRVSIKEKLPNKGPLKKAKLLRRKRFHCKKCEKQISYNWHSHIAQSHLEETALTCEICFFEEKWNVGVMRKHFKNFHPKERVQFIDRREALKPIIKKIGKEIIVLQ